MNLKMAISTATMGHLRSEECINSWTGTHSFPEDAKTIWETIDVLRCRNVPGKNLGVLGSYKWLYENSTAPIVAFIHDDVIILDVPKRREDCWNERVLSEFDDPQVGLVGFGGATAHGTDDLYTSPYCLQNLARMGFASNLVDAEAHGERSEGSREVAVLDGFFMAARREMLDKFSWPTDKLFFHCYDYFFCCMARRLGYKIRMVGVKCQHLGGATSVGMGVERQGDHERSHRYIWEEFRDVLPARV